MLVVLDSSVLEIIDCVSVMKGECLTLKPLDPNTASSPPPIIFVTHFGEISIRYFSYYDHVDSLVSNGGRNSH